MTCSIQKPPVRLHALVWVMGCVMGMSLSAPLQAASERNLQRYAESVDFLDRWRGEREMLDEAHERLSQLLIEEPDFAPAHVEMARWYLMNSRNHEAALRSLERAEALDPGFPGTFVLRGYVFERQNRLEDALQQLDRAEALGTDNPWLPLNRASVFEKLGRIEDALPLYESVFENHRDDPKAWPSAKLGLVQLYTRTGKTEEAEAVLLRAKALHPDDPAEAASYWEWLSTQGRLDEAVAMVREARKRWDSPELAQHELWLLLSRSNQLLSLDRDASRTVFEEATTLATKLGVPMPPSFDDWVRMQEPQHEQETR